MENLDLNEKQKANTVFIYMPTVTLKHLVTCRQEEGGKKALWKWVPPGKIPARIASIFKGPGT